MTNTLILIIALAIAVLFCGAFKLGQLMFTPNVTVTDTRIPDGARGVKYYWDFNRETGEIIVIIGKWRHEPRVIKGKKK